MIDVAKMRARRHASYLKNAEAIKAQMREKYIPVSALSPQELAQRRASKREYQKLHARKRRSKFKDDLNQKSRERYAKDERVRNKMAEDSKKYREANKDRLRAYIKDWSEKNRESQRHKRVTKIYGLSSNEYFSMLLAQGYLCCICQRPETVRDNRSGRTRNLAVDHNHETGKVRGLLCSSCNRGISFFNEDVLMLKSAIKYLETAKAGVQALAGLTD